MADQTHHHTDREYVRETTPAPSGGGNAALAFIVGGLVIAVVALALVFYDFGDLGGGSAVAPTEGDNVSISVESSGSGEAASTEGGETAAPAESGASAGAEAGATASDQ